MAWKKLAEKGAVSSGKGKAFKIDEKQIAIFNQGDKYHAIDDLCAHQDGSIAPGKLDGDIVECPLQVHNDGLILHWFLLYSTV